jgi:CheY-like chemotaxis protein
VSAPRAHGFGRVLIEETVRSYGGSVSVHYHRDGLTCEIDLPLPEQPPAIIGPEAVTQKIAARPSLLAAPDQRRTLEGKRILVIEDEPLVSMEMESDLEAAGCDVIGPAATLDEAKTLVEDSDYDAALLDVNLKGQPVDELATLLTKKNCPFAFVTGYGRDALPSGFRGAVVLGKPFSSDQLLATAEVVLYQADRVVQLRHKKP